MKQLQNQTLLITHKQLNLEPIQFSEDIMESGQNWERYTKISERKVQYYDIIDPEKKKQALLVFYGREVTICEYSLPDLESNGDL